MPHPLWFLHLAFWWPFIVRGQLQRSRGEGAHLGEVTHAHPRAVHLVVLHTVVTVVMYAGIGLGVRDPRAQDPTPQMVIGTALIILGSVIARWTLRTFRSWRLRAEITERHELSTDGPFRFVRHPIYAAMNLLAVGTAVWIPNPFTLAAAVGMIVVGDVRGRAEESLLLTAFGDAYRVYMARVKRLLPFVY